MPQHAWTPGWRPSPEQVAETPEILRLTYLRYRRREALRLLHVVPTDAVRDLYARARAWARRRNVHDARDPMATLARYAERLLPLPPFEVWLADRERHPLTHVEAAAEAPHAEPARRPGRIGERRLELDGCVWLVSLHVFRDGGSWRGFLRFQDQERDRRYHTANIFLEDTPQEVRQRFRDFDPPTMGAFLRSVLP